MNNPTVAVMMSTYNGEKYIREQIDSILNQKDVNIKLIIRDDGSGDSTSDIIKHYADTDKRVSYICGENLGASRSFFELIKQCATADYYSFSDQDDVWEPDKTTAAIRMIAEENDKIPVVYYSNLKIVDENLNFCRMSHQKPHIQDNRYCALVGNMASGCTMVLNNSAMQLVKRSIPERCDMHDWWIFALCSFFGKLIYDFEGHINYRQHGNNVAGTYTKHSSLKFVFKRLKLLVKPKEQPRYTIAANIYDLFKDELSAEDLLRVREFAEYKKSWSNTFRLLTDKEIHAATKKRDLVYRFCVLFRIA